MRIGSLFSGIGGLDLAVEAAFGGCTVWQVERDPYCVDVLERRWPGLDRLDDVHAAGRVTLSEVDILCGGFPCQDLSVAGKGAGLDGKRSGLYRELLRVAAELRPRYVVIENVPKLLHYRDRLEADFRGLGYGLRWCKIAAAHVGMMHVRKRIFVLAVRGWHGHGRLVDFGKLPDVDNPWTDPGLLEAARWPAVLASHDKRGGAHAEMDRHSPQLPAVVTRWPTAAASRSGTNIGGAAGRVGPVRPSLDSIVRWPTATAGDAKASGSRSLSTSDAHSGTSLTDAVRPGRVTAEAARWASASARDWRSGAGNQGTGDTFADRRVGSPQLPEQLGGCLSPAWVEALMGLPIGWTDLEVDEPEQLPGVVAPRIIGLDGASPQHPWEPPRTVVPRSVPFRPARLRAIGNAVVPAQAEAALMLLGSAPRQGELGLL